MAQPKDFLYSLVDDAGRSYRVENGVVKAASDPKPLNTTPDGWQEAAIKYQRNIRLGRLFRTYTNPLKYVKDAAVILRSRLYTKGTEDRIYQVIHWLDKSFGGGWTHRFFYRGELDLTQVNDEDTHVEVNVMEGGLSKLLKANEATVYEIDIDVPEAVIVKMDGILLRQRATFVIGNGDLPNNFQPHIPAMGLVGVEQIEQIGAVPTNRTIALDAAAMYASGENALVVPVATQVTIEYKFGVTIGLAPGISPIPGTRYLFQVRAFNKDGVMVFDQSMINFGADPLILYGHHLFSGTATYNIPGETTLYVRSTITANPTTTSFVYDTTYADEDGGLIKITYNYRQGVSFIKALRPAYIAQKLLDKITGGGYTFSSTYLSTVWENLLTTSQDAVRKIPGAKLKISWNDFFDSYHVRCNLSCGIKDQVLYVERKREAFQSTIQQHLTGATGLVISTAKDFQYSSLKIGYPNSDTENLNGRDEFNVTQTYTSPVTRSNKVLELVSKIRASMYEIEIARINLEGKTTTDDSNDNSAYFLHVEKSSTAGGTGEPAVHYKLFRNTYDSITGLISPATAFNVELSPKRCLLEHGDFLHGVFWGLDAGYLVFQSSQKNADLTTIKAGVTISEKGNVLIGSLPAPMFIPLTFEFTSPMPRNIMDVLEAGPDGTFSFEYDGAILYGFPMEVGIQPADRPAQETTLLCSPQTDLTKLITYGR